MKKTCYYFCLCYSDVFIFVLSLPLGTPLYWRRKGFIFLFSRENQDQERDNGGISQCFGSLYVGPLDKILAYQIRFYLYGSGSLHEKAKKFKKNFEISIVLCLHNLLSLRTDVSVPTVPKSKKISGKKTFASSWHFESHWRKRQYSNP